MSVLRQLLRKPRSSAFDFTYPRARFNSTKESRLHSRLSRLQARLPPFLHPYTSTLLSAPASSITSFLILHEITAIVPLVALATAFHYGGWLPETWTEARYVREGIERFGRYFGGKGWFGFTRAQDTGKGEVLESDERNGEEGIQQQRIEQVEDRWGVSEGSGRILVEVATAYAITKVFLPARILLSVWATPWFARVVLGNIAGGVRKIFGKAKAP